MTAISIAMDIGTSGIRAQALDGSDRAILKTAITTGHPLPGANVIDHLHFALEMGVDTAQAMLVGAVNRVIQALQVAPAHVVRLAVCGNPAQLSIFQGVEIRDLAYAGTRKLARLNIGEQRRDAVVASANDIFGLALPAGCQVIVPPAVRHEVGADALAMIALSGMREAKETALAVDFGTNAEMALIHKGRVITASAAAGPALEGQGIACGLLAVPGAVCDLLPDKAGHRVVILDDAMRPVVRGCVRLDQAEWIVPPDPYRAIGITGTGTLALVDQGLEAGVITRPHIHTPDGRLHIGERLFLDETDLVAAGKAIGAIQAALLTLCQTAGIDPEAIRTVYMAGASGTYMDTVKARRLGMIPPLTARAVHIGNTSLAMARRLAADPEALNPMRHLATSLRANHCMLSGNPHFQQAYILELARWTEGMPLDLYRQFLDRYGLPRLPPPSTATIETVRRVTCDIEEVGKSGLTTIDTLAAPIRRTIDGCDACQACIEACPSGALRVDPQPRGGSVALTTSRCNGVGCRRCENACPGGVLHLERFFRVP